VSATLLLRDRPGIPLNVDFEDSGQFESWKPEPEKAPHQSESAKPPSMVS
jgi:hypothetical protein